MFIYISNLLVFTCQYTSNGPCQDPSEWVLSPVEQFSLRYGYGYSIQYSTVPGYSTVVLQYSIYTVLVPGYCTVYTVYECILYSRLPGTNS